MIPDSARPITILTLDLEQLPEEIQAVTGSRLAWVLVRRAGRPLALLELPVDGKMIRNDAIRQRLAALPTPVVSAETRLGDEQLPRATVIVPSMLARAAELRRCLDSLQALDYPDAEILVVDNRPAADNAVPEWLTASGVRLVREPRPGIAAARNRGLSAARGEIIAFTDDDVIADPDWLRRIAEHFVRHPEDACVTGLVMPTELETEAQLQFEGFYGGGFGEARQLRRLRWRVEADGALGLPSVEVVERGEDGSKLRTFSIYAAGTFGAGVNCAFRAAALSALGGFRPELGTGTPSLSGEDLEVFATLAWRGFGIGYEPAALVYHSHRRDYPGLRRQIRGYGTGFVAYLLALIARDPRHVARIVLVLPRAVAETARRVTARVRGARPTAAASGAGAQVHSEAGTAAHGRDRELACLELLGMIQGPAGYLASRRAARRWRST